MQGDLEGFSGGKNLQSCENNQTYCKGKYQVNILLFPLKTDPQIKVCIYWWEGWDGKKILKKGRHNTLYISCKSMKTI